MPDTMLMNSARSFALSSDKRRERLQECAQYCRRLARQSDRPEAVRSLAALAAEFEAEAAVPALPDDTNSFNPLLPLEWQLSA